MLVSERQFWSEDNGRFVDFNDGVQAELSLLLINELGPEVQ